jgi:hypothetical protein
MGYIERLKEKPEHVKQRIQYISVFVIMSLIIALWIGTFKSRFIEKDETVEGSNPVSLIGRAFSSIKEDISERF